MGSICDLSSSRPTDFVIGECLGSFFGQWKLPEALNKGHVLAWCMEPRMLRSKSVVSASCQGYQRLNRSRNSTKTLISGCVPANPSSWESRAHVIAQYPELRNANEATVADSWVALPLMSGGVARGGLAFGLRPFAIVLGRGASICDDACAAVRASGRPVPASCQ